MEIKITVDSVANDTPYGGTQNVAAKQGEYILDGIFRLNFFRIIIDEVIDDAVCFRLMEGASAHYFVLEGKGDAARYERETPLGYDSFTFELV
ncbi:MAG: hypothetical protein LUD27_07290 [Clostridia bacterium]|nr:hypothetical protein [Clostridia bacterium]